MGFEYVYALQENLKYGIYFGIAMSIVWLIFGGALRYENKMDKDDWVLFMGFGVFCLVLSVLGTLAPGLDHIKEVRAAMLKLDKVVDSPAPASVECIQPPSFIMKPALTIGEVK